MSTVKHYISNWKLTKAVRSSAASRFPYFAWESLSMGNIPRDSTQWKHYLSDLRRSYKAFYDLSKEISKWYLCKILLIRKWKRSQIVVGVNESPNEERFSLLTRKEGINGKGTLYCKTENIWHIIEMKKSIPPCSTVTRVDVFPRRISVINWKIKLNFYITVWHIVFNKDITKHILVHRYRALVGQSF